MENEIYWLWLQGALGYADKKAKAIVDFFGDARTVYEADAKELRDAHISGLGPKAIGRLKDEDIEKYYDTYDFCKNHKIHIITPDSEYYPKRLREIENLPYVLYVRGDYKCLNAEKALAVIGSRTPSEYGEEAAREIVNGLCKENVLIVSGGALGIDSVAHTGAIENGGKTVLVMGCGHGSGYLPQNSELRKRVAQNGALVTEYPPYTNVGQNTFPQRNRIISGMSSGVVIAEAAQFSGTFSTARHAVRQGREVFVLPGDINSGNFEGSNQLITEGAKPVFSAENILYGKAKGSPTGEKTGKPFENILEESSFSKNNPEKKAKRKPKKKSAPKAEKEEVTLKEEKNNEKNIKINMETISKNAGIVYNIMSDGICDFDGIVRESEIQVNKVLSALTELEMKGIISREGPNRYSLN